MLAIERTPMQPDVSDLCERYQAVYTGVVADAMDSLDMEIRDFPKYLTPLFPNITVAGPAYPVRGEGVSDGDYDNNIRTILKMLEHAPCDSILLTEAQDDRSAHLGELSTTALSERGCRGAIIDGGIRDVQFIRDQKFPVYSRYRTPVDAPPRWRITERNVPITVDGMTIEPGDFLVGDDDGLLCVPQDDVTTVLERAEEKVETEDDVRKSIRNGTSPLDAYETHGTF